MNEIIQCQPAGNGSHRMHTGASGYQAAVSAKADDAGHADNNEDGNSGNSGSGSGNSGSGSGNLGSGSGNSGGGSDDSGGFDDNSSVNRTQIPSAAVGYSAGERATPRGRGRGRHFADRETGQSKFTADLSYDKDLSTAEETDIISKGWQNDK
jgi:hypothetical protein